MSNAVEIMKSKHLMNDVYWNKNQFMGIFREPRCILNLVRVYLPSPVARMERVIDWQLTAVF